MRPGRKLRIAPPGFSLVELLVVVGLIAILSSLLLPALARAKGKGASIVCLNQQRQLGLAWMMYSVDHEDRLPYNLGEKEIRESNQRNQHYNWANSLHNWELDPENTNGLLNTEAALGSYVSKQARMFRCPSDRVVSRVQREAGWRERCRSISMNAMVGDAGEFTRSGSNVNNPYYHQFLKMGEFKSTTSIFVFIEEHPDSIDDGYFLNKIQENKWIDLPASYHNGAANLTFGDGHAESHRWLEASTKRPNRPDAAATVALPLPVEERRDFYWLLERTSVYQRNPTKSPY